MVFNFLAENPDVYRSGLSFQSPNSTNNVFPIRFNCKDFIVKRPNYDTSLRYVKFFLYESLFYRSRRLSTPAQGIRREAEMLKQLDGFYSPKFVAYDCASTTLVREYIDGVNFEKLETDKERAETLDQALASMELMHGRNIVIGDSNVKNIYKTKDGVCWGDFDGVFNNGLVAMAIDVLKFVYSVWEITQNRDIIIHAAEATKNYSNARVKENIRRLVNPGHGNVRTGLYLGSPISHSLNENIKIILRS